MSASAVRRPTAAAPSASGAPSPGQPFVATPLRHPARNRLPRDFIVG